MVVHILPSNAKPLLGLFCNSNSIHLCSRITLSFSNNLNIVEWLMRGHNQLFISGGTIFTKFHSITSSCLLTVVELFRKRSHVIIMYFCPQIRSPKYKHTHSAQRWFNKNGQNKTFCNSVGAESPVSSEISHLRNFCIHARCVCAEQHSTYQIR